MFLPLKDKKGITVDERKYVLAEKPYKFIMTLISKIVYIDKQDDIVDKNKNTYRSTTKMKFIDVKSSTYIDFSMENNDRDPKLKADNHVRISNIKTFLQKLTLQIGLKKFLLLRKLKILFRGHM